MEQIIQALIAELVKQALPHVIAAAQHQSAVPAHVPMPVAGLVPPVHTFAATAPTAAAPSGMFGTAAAAPATAPSVTPDMVQALVIPLVQNEQVKAALTAQMQAMGINNLPDTTPAQLPELYARFQEVERQARAAGLIGGPATAAPSII